MRATVKQALWGLVACVVGWTPAVARTPAPQIAIHDTLADFWKFWDAARDRPPSEQTEAWTRLYYGPHRDVLSAVPCGPLNAAQGPLRAFGAVGLLADDMHRIADRLPSNFPIARKRFLTQFPDMAWSGDIYIVFSGLCFDGKPATVAGRSALLFGPDVMASVHETDAIPLVQHEMFHIYHRQYFTDVDHNPAWDSLWTEGLAVFAAKTLNPHTENINLLTSDTLVTAVAARRAELARDFLTRFESQAESDSRLYFQGGSTDPRIPSRAGYVLGELVAENIAKTRGLTVRQMAHLTREQARPLVLAALQELAR